SAPAGPLQPAEEERVVRGDAAPYGPVASDDERLAQAIAIEVEHRDAVDVGQPRQREQDRRADRRDRRRLGPLPPDDVEDRQADERDEEPRPRRQHGPLDPRPEIPRLLAEREGPEA